MLTNRQLDILNYFLKTNDTPIELDFLSKSFNIGARSISNDLKSINNYLSQYSGAIKKVNSNSFVLDTPTDTIAHIKSSLQLMQKQLLFDSIDSRIEYILVQLLNTKDYIKSSQLCESMFISESRMSKDLEQIRKILSNYNLKLVSKPYHGIQIKGLELDKRRLIINENIGKSLFFKPSHSENDSKIAYISQLLTDLLIEYHFKVSDLVFQNLIVHIYNSVDRLSNGYFLEPSKDLEPMYSHALDISSHIFKDLETHYDLPYSSEEVKTLAINLQSKREYDTQEYINEEINQIVLNNLKIIKKKFDIDLTNNVDLRVALALHTIPLITRINSKRQLKNTMTYEIKQKNAYAFDIASEYAYQLCQKYRVKVTDDEIAYLTIHFIIAIQETIDYQSTKKILIVSSQRKTNTILIRTKLQQWFLGHLSIECINSSEYSESLSSLFQIILTTEPDFIEINPNAVLIDLFPTEKDRIKIELALMGLSTTNEVLQSFHPSLFYYGDVKDKEDMLKILCSKIEKLHPTNNQLIKSVLSHERKVSSYFGNQFAIPHPDSQLTNNTYICVGIPKNELTWDDNEGIKIVFLICIGKKDPKEKALQIWEYLSYLIQDPSQIDKILKEPTYSNFIHFIYNFYCKIIGK